MEMLTRGGAACQAGSLLSCRATSACGRELGFLQNWVLTPQQTAPSTACRQHSPPGSQQQLLPGLSHPGAHSRGWEWGVSWSSLGPAPPGMGRAESPPDLQWQFDLQQSCVCSGERSEGQWAARRGVLRILQYFISHYFISLHWAQGVVPAQLQPRRMSGHDLPMDHRHIQWSGVGGKVFTCLDSSQANCWV